MKKYIFLVLLFSLYARAGFSQSLSQNGGPVHECLGSVDKQYTTPQIVNANLMETICEPQNGSPQDGYQIIESARGYSYRVHYGRIWSIESKVTMRWLKAGVYKISQKWCGSVFGSDDCFNTEWRSLTVIITDPNNALDPSAFTLTSVNNCPAPNTQFTITRTNQSNPYKDSFIGGQEVDAAGNGIAGWWCQTSNGCWDNGMINTKTFGTSSFNFQPGKRYEVKLAVSSGCQNWKETVQYFTTATGLPVIAPTIQSNGTDVAGSPISLFSCKTLTLKPNITVNGNCTSIPGYTVKVARNVPNTCTPTGVAADVVTKNYSSTGASTINLFTEFPTILSSAVNGDYTITVSATNTFGTTTATPLCVRITTLNSEFGFAQLNVAACSGTSCGIRSTTESNPTIMGALTASICPPSVLGTGTVTQIEVKVEKKVNSFWVPIAGAGITNGIVQQTVNGWSPSSQNSQNLNSLFNGYFQTEYANLLVNDVFKVTFRVFNTECSWTDPSKASIGYFRISKCSKFARLNTHNTTDTGSTTTDSGTSFSPNPTTGKGIIYWSGETETPATLSIFDVNGREVLQVFKAKQLLTEDAFEVNLDALNTGIYFYRLTADKIYSGKIVKE